MATRYVSNTASNGYVVGTDSGTATTKATAWLTLDYAISHATSGDTIILNDGTYTAATFFNPSNTLTINAENDGLAILKRTGAQARVINYGGATGGLTLGAVTIDGELTATSCLTVSNSVNTLSLTLNGTRFLNPASEAVKVNATKINTIVRNINISGTCPGGGLIVYTLASGFVDVDGCVLNLTNVTTASTGGIFVAATATGVQASIQRVSGSITTNNVSSSSAIIYVSNVVANITNNIDMTISGQSGSLISVTSSALVLAEGSVISNNKGTNNCTSGWLVVVGTDGASANDNQVNYPIVIDNEFIGNSASTTQHGILLGSIKGGIVSHNKITNVVIPLVSKLQTEKSYWVGNTIINCNSTGGGLRAKGSTNTVFAKNLIYYLSNSGPALQADKDPTIPTLSLGIIYTANIVYATNNQSSLVTVGSGTDSSTATFIMNNYDLASISGTPYSYQGTTYATTALWSVAQEANLSTSNTWYLLPDVKGKITLGIVSRLGAKY